MSRDESGKSRDESARGWDESAARASRPGPFQPPLTNQKQEPVHLCPPQPPHLTTPASTPSQTRQREAQQPVTQTTPNAAQRLRTTMAAVRLAFTWLGVRKTLAPEQRTTAARAFHADRELLSAGRRQLDRCRDQVVLQVGTTARCPTHSGRTERRTRSCDRGRQDRGVTPVGLGSVPIGGSGGSVFAVGRSWRKGAESGAGGLRLAVKTQRGAGPFGNLLPSRWNQSCVAASGPLATAERQVAAAGQTGEGHGVGGGC